MNLLVLTINYAPEQTGFAPHTTVLCEYLAKRGHAATVITGFPFAPYWSRWPDYRGRFFSRQTSNGVIVQRVTHFVPRKPRSVIGRLLLEGTFCLTAAWAAFFLAPSRWDAILYVGAQPSIAMLARLIAFLHGVPYALKVNDLAAQLAVEVGIGRANWLSSILNRFEYSAYRAAQGAIVVCESFREALVANGYPAERIRVILDAVDLDVIRPLRAGNAFRSEHNLSPDDFVVLFSGSMGLKQAMRNIVEAARLLKADCPSVRWVLVGDGELKPRVAQLVREYDLAREVRLLPLQPQGQMSAMFSSADLLLLNQLSVVKNTVIPSKLLTYMAAGLAVIAAVHPSSQGAALIRETHGGVLVTPEDPAALATAVKTLMTDRAELDAMGQRNRRYSEQHFDQRKNLAAQEAFLIEVASRGP